MAEVSTVVQQPPEFIEAAAKPYLTQLQKVTGELKEADLSQIYGPQYVAGLGALTQQAIGQAGGLGAYASCYWSYGLSSLYVSISTRCN
jgi:hypothetical protein